MHSSKATTHESHIVTTPMRTWVTIVLTGVGLAVASVFFMNVMIDPEQIGFQELDVPAISLSTVLGFYGILATVVVALAFTKSPRFKDADTESLRQEVQKSNIVVFTTTLLSVVTVMSAIYYVLGVLHPVMRGADAASFSVETLLSLGAVCILAGLVSLMGALVSPTPEYMAMRALVHLPGAQAKVEQLERNVFQQLGSVPQTLDKQQFRFQLARITLLHLAWILVTFFVIFLIPASLLGVRPENLWVLTPLVSVVLFLGLTAGLMFMVVAGWHWPLAVIRWLGIVFLGFTALDFALLLQDLSGTGQQNLLLAYVLSAMVLMVIITPWILQRTPRQPDPRRLVVQHVYAARVLAVTHAMATVKRHIAEMEHQVEQVRQQRGRHRSS